MDIDFQKWEKTVNIDIVSNIDFYEFLNDLNNHLITCEKVRLIKSNKNVINVYIKSEIKILVKYLIDNEYITDISDIDLYFNNLHIYIKNQLIEYTKKVLNLRK